MQHQEHALLCKHMMHMGADPSPVCMQPLILERIPDVPASRAGGPVAWIHTKALYRLTQESRDIIQGCTDEMCSTSHSSQGLDAL